MTILNACTKKKSGNLLNALRIYIYIYIHDDTKLEIQGKISILIYSFNLIYVLLV